MLGRTTGCVLVGIDAHLVDVEVDLGGGLPSIHAVGLPDVAVREGIDRIRAALPHAGYKLPARRVTVNLAPAEVRKRGSSLDLPMAIALLVADGRVSPEAAKRAVIVGELGLDGSVRAVRGMLSIAMAARRAGHERIVVPRRGAELAGLVDGLTVVPAASLADAVAAFREAGIPPLAVDAARALRTTEEDGAGAPDLADVRGQSGARRALEIAAAGGHHLLLSGPPGSGKTLLARRLPGLLPPLVLDEALEVTRVWSAVGLCDGLVGRRPFRAPHHGITPVGLAGGGAVLRPGEISLATHGVLYLDELTEFRREALETMRQPLEEGLVRIVRQREAAVFPARFTLIASMNPCPCGYHGSAGRRCRCTVAELRRYRRRLSGPLLDRFDLTVDVPPVEIAALTVAAAAAESSADVRQRVRQAWRRQRERFGETGPRNNGAMSSADLARHVRLEREAERTLVAAARRLGLSARGFDRVRRVARTLADLEGARAVGPAHVAEAAQYRRRDPWDAGRASD